MDFWPRDSDSDYAFRLQMEEVLAASLSSRSRTTQRPLSPPIVATYGIAMAVENDRNESTAKAGTADVRLSNRGYDFDFRKAVGEGNSKGKGRIYESVPGHLRIDDPNPNIGLGNFRNTSGNDNRRPSPVTRAQETVPPAQLDGEGSSKVNAAAGNFNGNVLYRLYSKGLVSEENGKGKMTDVLAGIGVAICDQRDNLLFEMKEPLIGNGTNRQAAEIKALTRGLTEALKLGIKHIAIFCDNYPIFQYVRGKWVAKQKKISLLLNDLQRIMQQFSSSQPVLVAGNDVKFAYKLARESILSKVTPYEDPRLQAKAVWKEDCVICYNDIDAQRMFSVEKCRHRFCCQCVKQHVEVKLLHGMVPKCPHDGCESELVIDACGRLLTPKLNTMWKQRIKENAIPVTQRVYCPNPRCSALMSKTKISESAKSLLSVYPDSGIITCGKCQHMIELKQGCNHITCRCGYEFCYHCGGGWNKNLMTCAKRCPTWNEAHIMRQDPAHAFVEFNNYFDDDDEDKEDYDDYDYDQQYIVYDSDGLEVEDFMKPCWDTRVFKQKSPIQPKKKRLLTGAGPSTEAEGLIITFLNGLQDPIFVEEVNKYMGEEVSQKLTGEETTPIYCYTETEKTFLLRWISSKRAAVTLLERLIGFKWGKHVVGPVRNQSEHLLCWAFVAVDLVSAVRVIEELDCMYKMLSVKELCFFASPKERVLRRGPRGSRESHKCHLLSTNDGLQYIKMHGVREHFGNEVVDCKTGAPKQEGDDMIKIFDVLFIGDNLNRALKRLVMQPIGATLVLFSPEYETIGREVYRGPTSHRSLFSGFHAVIVVAALMVSGELVLECKCSDGEDRHDKGYIKVSAATMVMGVTFNGGPNATCGLKLDHDNASNDDIDEPTPLISEFVCPMFHSSEFVRRR